jgi:raw score 9.88
MRKLITFILVLLPFFTTSVIAAPVHKNQINKKIVVTKSLDKKQQTKKTKETKSALTKKTSTKNKKQVVKLTDKKPKVLVKEISSKPKASIEKKTTVVSAKHEKTAKEKPVYKPVIVPQCNDFSVSKVLSDAFKQQGDSTKTSMMVKQILQARETQFYPQKGIRSCHALVVTDGKSYQTDYSVILNDKGFFIQVENAQ